MSYKLFICHSSIDKLFVRKLSKELEKFGTKPWIDEREIKPGDSIVELIEKALNTSDFVIVVLSPHAVKSYWVKKELAAALHLEVKKKKKHLIPILIKNCKLPVFLMDKKYADFRSKFETGFEDLLQTMGLYSKSIFSKDFFVRKSLVTLDIKNNRGDLVKYTKEGTFIAEKPESIYLTESFTVDGKMKDFKVQPGSIDKVWVESGITYVRNKLPFPIQEGKMVKRTFKATFINAFTKSSEYWEGKQTDPGDYYEIRVVFPKSRHPISWEVYERDGTETKPSNYKARKIVANNRQCLRLIVRKPVLNINYVLRWWW
jgi:TIR domain-containing protein